jgi:hypothetical protein
MPTRSRWRVRAVRTRCARVATMATAGRPTRASGQVQASTKTGSRHRTRTDRGIISPVPPTNSSSPRLRGRTCYYRQRRPEVVRGRALGGRARRGCRDFSVRECSRCCTHVGTPPRCRLALGQRRRHAQRSSLADDDGAERTRTRDGTGASIKWVVRTAVDVGREVGPCGRPDGIAARGGSIA